MTDALAFLHSCHLVHTQLSSHAVMMVGGRQAKLAQFEGVVRAGGRFKPQKRSSWDEILPWVAPELVVGGRKAEQRIDMYSRVFQKTLFQKKNKRNPPRISLGVSLKESKRI